MPEPGGSIDPFRLFFLATVGSIPPMGITPQQLKQIQERLNGPRRAAAPVFERTTSTAASARQIILGVDPSLRGTGYGVIRLAKPVPETLVHGTISCPANWERSQCLVKIVQGLREVLDKHHPEICVMEALFFAQNLQTALIMGEARGAALATIAEAGLTI